MNNIINAAFTALLGGVILGPIAIAQDTDARILALEKKVEALSRNQEKLNFGAVVTDLGESKFGMGPSASKVYHKDEGVSIGGYGEALYENFDGKKTDQLDLLRAVIYFGYKFNEHWVFNSEIEFEHAATDKEGSTSVEFAYLDYLFTEALNFRAGLILLPVGLVNELHEPNVFLSAKRSNVESRIIPTTWREGGLGIFGDLGPIHYKAYIVNSLNASGFSEKGIRDGRQKGSKAKAEDFSGVLRVDLNPAPGLLFGASIYYGDSGQDLAAAVSTEIVEGHFTWNWQGFSARGLYAMANIDDVAALNRINNPDKADTEIDSIGEELEGWYIELGFNVFNFADTGEKSLTPFIRIEEMNTQVSSPAGFETSSEHDVEVITIGLNFKPLDEIVFKADVQFYDDAANKNPDQFNLAMGYVF